MKERIKFKIFACNKINQRKYPIYIHDYNIPDIDYYDCEIKKECNLANVQKSTWIKTKNTTSTPVRLTFKEKEKPRFIEIPGEQAKTKVHELYERPMSCKTCLRYGHTLKSSHETKATCARCSSEGLNNYKWTSTEITYYLSGADP